MNTTVTLTANKSATTLGIDFMAVHAHAAATIGLPWDPADMYEHAAEYDPELVKVERRVEKAAAAIGELTGVLASAKRLPNNRLEITVCCPVAREDMGLAERVCKRIFGAGPLCSWADTWPREVNEELETAFFDVYQVFEV